MEETDALVKALQKEKEYKVIDVRGNVYRIKCAYMFTGPGPATGGLEFWSTGNPRHTVARFAPGQWVSYFLTDGDCNLEN